MGINKKTALLILSALLILIAFVSIDGINSIAKVLPLFKVKTMLMVSLLFFGATLLSFVRIWLILCDFGHKISFLEVMKACAAGNIGGLFFIPVFGQIAGRQFYLAKLGVSPVENAAISGYERVVAGVISAFFALIGLLNIYGLSVIEQSNLTSLAIFIISASLAVYIYLKKIISTPEKQSVKDIAGTQNILLLIRTAAIIALGMLLTMACFALMFSTVLPEASGLEVISIAFIVSFLASLPISFGGWGLREISSMFFVSLLGGASEAGLAASIFMGLISMAIVLLFYPVLMIGKRIK